MNAILDTPALNGSHPTTETSNTQTPTSERYRLSVEEWTRFRRDGFLLVPQLVSAADVAELREHTEDLMQGRLPQQTRVMSERNLDEDMGETGQGLEAPPAHLSPEEKAQYFLRLHMLHRKLELHERFMLHPRVLDALESLIGPDVLAMQTMLFLKPPGKPGQGWHQDSYYIPTHPDTLCGAWIAIDDVDEENGAMWFAQGSQNEPIYPPRKGYGHGQSDLKNIIEVGKVSNPDDEVNDLARVANKYPQVLATAKAGDVVFFGGHVLHRSKKNLSQTRMRRSFVSHYCNARSFTQWNGDGAGKPTDIEFFKDTGIANGSHILARGDSHLPFAKPRFGTPCAALLPDEERRAQREMVAAMMADMSSGDMAAMPADPNAEHDHADEDGVL